MKDGERRIRGLIEDLKVAAIPTNPDVVTLCGGPASRAVEDIEALLAERDRMAGALEACVKAMVADNTPYPEEIAEARSALSKGEAGNG